MMLMMRKRRGCRSLKDDKQQTPQRKKERAARGRWTSGFEHAVSDDGRYDRREEEEKPRPRLRLTERILTSSHEVGVVASVTQPCRTEEQLKEDPVVEIVPVELNFCLGVVCGRRPMEMDGSAKTRRWKAPL